MHARRGRNRAHPGTARARAIRTRQSRTTRGARRHEHVPGVAADPFKHPDYVAEIEDLRRRAPREHRALIAAEAKLRAIGRQLGYPHSSAIVGSPGIALRELRPRRGNSPWRALYAVSPDLMLLAVTRDAQHSDRDFRAAVARAARRHAALYTESQE